MVGMKVEIEEKGCTPERMLRDMTPIRESAYAKLGKHFQEVNLPRRFTYSGGLMLGYEKRKPKYEAIKRKRKGHGDPLKWSGTSEKLATTIQDVRVKSAGTTTEVRVVIHARGLNRRNRHSTIRMNEEVRRIAPKEYGPLTRVLETGIDEEIKKRETQ